MNTEKTVVKEKQTRITKQTILPTGSFTKKQYAELNGLRDPAAYASIQKRIYMGIIKETGKLQTGKRGKPAVTFERVA